MPDRQLPEIAPTPLEELPHLSSVLGQTVLVKRDDLSDPGFGGNKIRKLVPYLNYALGRGYTDIITVGAAGSNSVLAMAIHGGRVGLAVHALALPHPDSLRARVQLEAARQNGATLWPARGQGHAALLTARLYRRLRHAGRRPLIVPPGATHPRSIAAYARAGAELRHQLADRRISAMFCALGTGGTAAGLLRSLPEFQPRPVRLHAVRVYPGPWNGRCSLGWLARASTVGLVIEEGALGPGYGHVTDAAREAQELFARDGLTLDMTYTAKTAAALIAHVRGARPTHPVVFWHTLSRAEPIAIVPENRPTLPEALDRLFVRDAAG